MLLKASRQTKIVLKYSINNSIKCKSSDRYYELEQEWNLTVIG